MSNKSNPSSSPARPSTTGSRSTYSVGETTGEASIEHDSLGLGPHGTWIELEDFSSKEDAAGRAKKLDNMLLVDPEEPADDDIPSTSDVHSAHAHEKEGPPRLTYLPFNWKLHHTYSRMRNNAYLKVHWETLAHLPPAPAPTFGGSRTDFIDLVKERMATSEAAKTEAGIAEWRIVDFNVGTGDVRFVTSPILGSQLSIWTEMMFFEPVGSFCDLVSRYTPHMIGVHCLMANTGEHSIWYTPWWPTQQEIADRSRPDATDIEPRKRAEEHVGRAHTFVHHHRNILVARGEVHTPGYEVEQVPAATAPKIIEHIFGGAAEAAAAAGDQLGVQAATVQYKTRTETIEGGLPVLYYHIPKDLKAPADVRPWIGQFVVRPTAATATGSSVKPAGNACAAVPWDDLELGLLSVLDLNHPLFPFSWWRTEFARGCEVGLSPAFMFTYKHKQLLGDLEP